MRLFTNTAVTLLLINIALALFVLLSLASGNEGSDALSQFIKWEIITITKLF